VEKRPEARGRLAAGIAMASSITSIGLEFSLPVGVGFLIDRHWHTTPVATLIGAVLGFLAGMMHTLTVAKSLSAPSQGTSPPATKVGRQSDPDRGARGL
jgi:F0F1-type ATP synthase assembly protein I